tara:strand:+ start:35 stop:313 length:279 start_codon:yes stop_codon:yes gene_type:complete
MEEIVMATARTKTSQHTKIVNFLRTGKSLSISYAKNKLGVTQLPARVTELRSQGFAIYTNENKMGNTTYRLGTPSRAMVAAAHAAAGSSVFS